MTRKPSTLGVTYQVRGDPQKAGRWIVLRGGAATGGFGNSMNMAIGSAIGLAHQEAKTSDLKVRVISVAGGKRTVEWQSP